MYGVLLPASASFRRGEPAEAWTLEMPGPACPTPLLNEPHRASKDTFAHKLVEVGWGTLGRKVQGAIGSAPHLSATRCILHREALCTGLP